MGRYRLYVDGLAVALSPLKVPRLVLGGASQAAGGYGTCKAL